MDLSLRLMLPDHRDQVRKSLGMLRHTFPRIVLDGVYTRLDHGAPVAYASKFDRSILFNVVKLNVTPGWSRFGVHYLTAHEYGHHVQFALDDKLEPGELQYYTEDLVGSYVVSAYALRRPTELFAELFAQYWSFTDNDFVVSAMESLLCLL